jgi:polyvinyl alcohol dehydrogenase (cytochrome)
VASGNGSNTSGTNPDYSDSVIELSPSMAVLQSFTPSTWQNDNANDLDLGSSTPVVMGDGLTLQIGKSQTAYVLDTSHLGGVGGQVAERSPVCGSDNDGGSAFTSTAKSSVVYVPCLSGVEAVKITKKATRTSIRVLWHTRTGASGPPILVGSLVWSIGQDGTLVGLHKGSGRPAVRESVGASSNHFPTPSVGDGLLLAPSDDQVVAFR